MKMTLILHIYLEKIHREENPLKIATRVPMPVKKITGYNWPIPWESCIFIIFSNLVHHKFIHKNEKYNTSNVWNSLNFCNISFQSRDIAFSFQGSVWIRKIDKISMFNFSSLVYHWSKIDKWCQLFHNPCAPH
mgnify:CR=1 FL=1